MLLFYRSTSRQLCAYALGVAAEKYPQPFIEYAPHALHSLSTCVSVGEEFDENDEIQSKRGDCTDTSVSSVGIILENMEKIKHLLVNHKESIDFNFVWGHWLDYLPLQNEVSEGHKVINQLIKLVTTSELSSLLNNSNPEININRKIQIIKVLLQVLDSELSTDILNRKIMEFLLVEIPYIRSISSQLGESLSTKFEFSFASRFDQELSSDQASSPLATSHINDVLLKR
jgi:hypothetical protein